MREDVEVLVVYALVSEQRLFAVRLPRGATVRTAIDESGVLQQFPELTARPWSAGIYGVRVGLDAVVSDGDRIEIYRPLVADPTESRRRRAARRNAART